MASMDMVPTLTTGPAKLAAMEAVPQVPLPASMTSHIGKVTMDGARLRTGFLPATPGGQVTPWLKMTGNKDGMQARTQGPLER